MWAWRWMRRGTSGTRRRACVVSGPQWVWGGAAVVVPCHCTCGRGCAVRFLPPFGQGGTLAAAVKTSGYLFNLRRHATTGKWYAQVTLRGVLVSTRCHKNAWQAAAELEWQLARWCAHTGELRSRYVSNAARLVELGRADAAGVLTEAVTVTPWELSRWDGGGGKAAPAGERLCFARGEACAVARHASLSPTHCAADAASAASSDSSSDSEEAEEEAAGDSDSDSDSESEEEAAGGGGQRRSASRAPAAPARPPPPPPPTARLAASGAGAGRRAPAPPPPAAAAAAAAPAPPRGRRLSRFAMSLRGLLPPVSDEVLASAVWRLYGVSAFEPTSSGGGVGRKRRRSEVAGGAGEEREGAAGGGSGGGRRRVGS
jgi:hypothetical protein